MKTSPSRKAVKCVAARLFSILLICLSVSVSCTNDDTDPVSNEKLPENCFSKSSLENTPWIKTQLQNFEPPNSIPLRVVVVLFRGEYFIVFAIASTSSPISHVFDCSGNVIGKRAENTNEFFDNAKLVEVLLEKNY